MNNRLTFGQAITAVALRKSMADEKADKYEAANSDLNKFLDYIQKEIKNPSKEALVSNFISLQQEIEISKKNLHTEYSKLQESVVFIEKENQTMQKFIDIKSEDIVKKVLNTPSKNLEEKNKEIKDKFEKESNKIFDYEKKIMNEVNKVGSLLDRNKINNRTLKNFILSIPESTLNACDKKERKSIAILGALYADINTSNENKKILAEESNIISLKIQVDDITTHASNEIRIFDTQSKKLEGYFSNVTELLNDLNYVLPGALNSTKIKASDASQPSSPPANDADENFLLSQLNTPAKVQSALPSSTTPTIAVEFVLPAATTKLEEKITVSPSIRIR